ncbi:hypothetical protein DJ82_02825 [Halorubrum sp. Ib24]|uniref:DUF7124 domain-containing protein n=1 Tax=unclassified Halorubrum TaxID=2642239 RepID=UPI000B99A2FB|nr:MULTISPECIES: hypothetical protein [unclassified Halorubrum]OYR42335.1 hypothetical protein DJ82_02825 [Halorubrum sp. Ib24]OYR45453.1 hypothetical protein DJ81_05015 [Halorubrum sp. Hd13]OYR45674.1 hypothetical protein DJ74_16020 [Halorubrum sp. Ea8]OYR55293.1 hypothetical protein DJ73_02580 [Halorubrum sp. Ea1]
MSLDVDADPVTRSGELTLVLSLGAARRLADPEAAFAEARRWSRYVGIVANDAEAVERFVREHGVENDYALRNWDKWGTLGDVYDEADTPRHVFVGTSPSDRRVATHVGFEYRPIGEAAEKADWELSDPRSADDSGFIDRIRRAVSDRL